MLQVRGSEYNSQRSQLGQVSRKQTGSLAVKDLGSIVSEKDVINTENLITLFVVVPRHQKKEWLSSYESITEYIVRLVCISLPSHPEALQMMSWLKIIKMFKMYCCPVLLRL